MGSNLENADMLNTDGTSPIPPIPHEVSSAESKGGRTLGPIILAHGLMGFDRIFFIHYFNGVVKHLREHGYEVHATRVSRTGSIAKRANELKETLLNMPELSHIFNPLPGSDTPEPLSDDTDPGAPVGLNIIAHSMGGLDTRYMITHLGMAPYVDSLTTISSPHHGTPFVDLLYSNVEEEIKIIDLAKKIQIDLEAFKDLSGDAIMEFNDKTPNMPHVSYYSIAGFKKYVHKREILWAIYNHILKNHGPNDGLVTVESAKWGTFLGTIEADHLEQVGWGNLISVPEDLKFSGQLKALFDDFLKRLKDSDFDHLAFYLDLVERLSEMSDKCSGSGAPQSFPKKFPMSTCLRK